MWPRYTVPSRFPRRSSPAPVAVEPSCHTLCWRGTKMPSRPTDRVGRARLFQPVHHVRDVRDVAVWRHPSAQARQHLAERSTGPMDIVVSLPPRQDLPLGVRGCPLPNALGSRGGCYTSFNAYLEVQRMHGMDAAFQRFVEASPPGHGAKERRHSATMVRASTLDP